MHTRHSQKIFSGPLTHGVGIVEVLVGISLLSVVLLFSVDAISRFASFGRQQVERTQALYLAEEMLEAARYGRDASWTTFVAPGNGTYMYVSFGTSTMTATTVPQTSGIFTPRYRLHAVHRANASDDIVASTSPVSKTVDGETRLVEAQVTWSGGSVSLYEYLADIAP